MRQVEVKFIAGWKWVNYEARVGRIPFVPIEITEIEDQREAGMSPEPTFLINVGNDLYSNNVQWSESSGH